MYRNIKAIVKPLKLKNLIKKKTSTFKNLNQHTVNHGCTLMSFIALLGGLEETTSTSASIGNQEASVI